jgi:DNA-binding SARP family transcriptional activator
MGRMPEQMEFCLLGPLLVRCDGVVLPVHRGKERTVLAALLLDANRIVSVDELAETLWGDTPPTSARVTIQNYVKRLRQALGQAGRARITTHPRGYRITVNPGELDVSRFEDLLAASRTASRTGSWDHAAANAAAALALWRDEALADVESDLLIRREVPRLAEMRMQAAAARVDADLHRGRYADVISELRQLIAVSPLWERLHAQLMLALYSDGRPAEALAAYQHVRRLLVGELGTEPGTELRELHQQILSLNPVQLAPQGRRLSVVESVRGAHQ